MRGLADRLSDSLRAFHDVFRNKNLRRLELAWAASELGVWVFSIALAIFAYQAAGALGVGLVGLIRMVPAALAAPFTALLADRFPRLQVMFLANFARALALALAALLVGFDAPVVLVYALVGVVSLLAVAFGPAQAAVLPSLARTPSELTAANVTSSTIESVAGFAGPALGGVLVAVSSTSVAFATTAGAFLLSALLIGRIDAVSSEGESPRPQSRVLREALAGFETIGRDRALRLLVGLYGAQTLVFGALNVLIVVVVLELLALDDAALGSFYSALAVGGLLGALVALPLAGHRRIASAFGLGLVLWGAPIALIAAWPDQIAAAVFLALVGVANTLVDVAGTTLLQRAVPEAVLARVFGVLESVIRATIALGSIIAPALIAGIGVRGALVATGIFLPLLALAAWRPLREIDAAAADAALTPELELLRSLRLFAPLPASTLEYLASSLAPVRVRAGERVFRQGDHGYRFFIIAAGQADVAVDGVPVARLSAGDFFGEIALLRDVPRTSTVSASTDLELYALERSTFITAVTGHPESAAAASAVIASRFALRVPRLASISGA